MSNKIYDITIIGGGVAGMYAGICAGLRKHDTLIIECSSELGGKLNKYPNKSILDLAGFKSILARDFISNLKEQLAIYDSSVEILLNSEVIGLDKQEDLFLLNLNNGQKVLTKTIVLANGMGKYSPRKIPYEAKNIRYHFNNPFEFKDKEVAILGGGDSAVDYAIMLQSLVRKLYLIHRRCDFRAKDESLFRLHKEVEILTPYLVDNIIIENKKANNLILSNSSTNEIKEVSIDEIIVAYGITQAEDIFQSLVTCDSNGISVNIDQETTYQNIFSIGDSCFYKAKYKNITSALGEAANAINFISNKLRPEKVSVYFSSTSN
ncbi:NAD(P)/FAD-dependent oxidoreductase [Acholeplasma sp. OttesenSCG-928-E16]|nr:NAD(P)/FAD-dependent oxidoreductase [Acholeplasma sp. OttesenSCG-928-E16]